MMDSASEEFLHALYGAVLDRQKWNDVTKRLADLGEGFASGIFDSDFAAGVVYRTTLHGQSEEANQRYMMEYASIDPRVPVVLGDHRLRWHSDHELFDEEFRNNSRIYQEFLIPNGAGETIFAAFARENSRLGTVVLVRANGQPKASAAIRERLDKVLPHMDRAAKISRRFTAMASEVLLGYAVLDALDEPLACATADGRMIRVNRAFEEALRLGGVFSLESGALRLRDPALQVQFLRAIKECCRIAEGQTGGDADAGLILKVDRATEPTCFVTVAPVASTHLRSWAGKPCAVIRLDESIAGLDPDKLVQVLGLSVAEARLVAGVVQGGSLIDVAQRLGISINTARTQLASAFSKTGTTRQAELVALIAAMPKHP